MTLQFTPVNLAIDEITIGATAKDLFTLIEEAYSLAGETQPDTVNSRLNYVRLQFADEVRVRVDNQDPTTTTGEQYFATDFFEKLGNINNCRFISVSGDDVKASLIIGSA